MSEVKERCREERCRSSWPPIALASSCGEAEGFKISSSLPFFLFLSNHFYTLFSGCSQEETVTMKWTATLMTLTTLTLSGKGLGFPISNLEGITKRADKLICNGHAELCDKKYSEVVYIGAHNSYAVGNSLSDNQNK